MHQLYPNWSMSDVMGLNMMHQNYIMMAIMADGTIGPIRSNLVKITKYTATYGKIAM